MIAGHNVKQSPVRIFVVDRPVERDIRIERNMFCLVAVLIAVIICLVIHSSANALKEAESFSPKIPYRFIKPYHSFLDDVLTIRPMRK